MIRVKRITGPIVLKNFLNQIAPDDPNPIVLVDTLGTQSTPPEYTIIWQEGDVVVQ